MIKIMLSDLSTEILLHIFTFCNINDLCRLKQTCVRFSTVIEYYFNSILKRPALVTNQHQSYIRDRSLVLLSGLTKWQISHNWQIGKYKKEVFLYERVKYIPWINLTSTCIWISRGHSIKAYKRQNSKIDVRLPTYILSGNHLAEISRFTKKDDCLVSGQRDGRIWIWSETTNRITTTTNRHQREVSSVDIYGTLAVSGSRDCSFKLWSCKNSFTEIYPITTQRVSDQIWSTNFSESGAWLAIGTSGSKDRAALKIFDLHSLTETYSLGGGFQRGVLDMKWESDNILLDCGYDSCIRKWDLRTGCCVQLWAEPFQESVHCLDIDKSCTLITGTQSCGRAVLFDTRATKYVQMYFTQTCIERVRNLPVNSLSFDATQLCIATDQHLSILDFTSDNEEIRNYSNL